MRVATRIALVVSFALSVPAVLQSHAASDHAADESRRAIAQHLALGKTLLGQGEALAAQAQFRAVLELDATQPDALRLMTNAQQQLEERQAAAAKVKTRLREQAQDLALKMVREKAKTRAHQEEAARAQVARAREQQLKLLYNRGLRLSRQGDYQAAIEMFQQMVLLEPGHPLVRDAQRLITRAELKQAEARAKVAARLSPGAGQAVVSDLEQQLTAKRIELETVFKYAKIAAKERNHKMAIQLLQRILAQDPLNRPAQQLLEQEQMTQLKEEETRLEQRVHLDEQTMVNEVVNAQRLPRTPPAQLTAATAPAGQAPTLSPKLQQPISFEFSDVALSDVLQFIADAANVSLIPSPRLDLKARRVTLKMREVPLELAIKHLARSLALAYRIDEDVIRIASAEEFDAEPLQTRVFFLRSGLSPFTLETAAVAPNPALETESIKGLIEQTVPQTPESKVVVDARNGALIITNTGQNLRLVEQLLSQLDVTPLQVLIEARFVELTQTELEEFGVESVLTGGYALTKEKAAGGGRGPGHVLAKGGGFKFSDLTRQDEGGNLTVEGVLTGLQFETVLHALEESKKSKTLSAPRVTTLNHQTATIKVVDEFNYPTKYEVSLIQFDINGDGDFDDAGETEFANVPQDIQKRDVGILLYVTPSVGKDLKTITLILAPEVSEFSQFRDLGGGVSVPEFTSRQLTTSVVIEDGQTVILGGLMKDTTTDQVSKIPVLGDLPLIGGLFRQTQASSERRNLLIFITARLLAPRGQTI